MSQGKQLIDLVYIDDVVHAFEVAAKKIGRWKSQEVGIVRPILWQAGHIAETGGTIRQNQRRGIADSVGWHAVPEPRGHETLDKGKEIARWTPKVTLEEGITRIIGKSMWKRYVAFNPDVRF